MLNKLIQNFLIKNSKLNQKINEQEKNETINKESPVEQKAQENVVEKPIPRFKFKVNQRLRITLNRPQGLKSFNTIIQEVFEDSIAISTPIEKGIYVYFQEQEVIDVSIYENSGIYTFSSVVLDKLSLPIPLVYLQKPKQVKRFQQREYIRTKAFLETQFRLSELQENNAMGNSRIVWSKDISAGGMCLSFPMKVSEQSVFNVWIEMPSTEGKESSVIQAQVKICTVRKDPYSDNYFVGAEFVKIEQEDRQKINGFVSYNERME